MLLSLSGTLLSVILLVLFFTVFGNDAPAAGSVAGGVLFIAAAFAIRVYFAMWYARDKGRSSALGFMALFGVLGWLFLIVTEDRKRDALHA